MRLPDGTILMHGRAPYDPVKAHEYYIRTRQLKGRKKGSNVPQTPTGARKKSSKFRVSYEGGKTVELTAQQLAEQQAYAAKRANDIKKSLAELGTKLKNKIADAKEREAKAKREAKKAPTAAEKSQAARESKKYREKHKTELATKAKKAGSKESTTATSKTDSVASLEKQITEIKGRLTAAVAKQRALASATQN